MKVEERRWEEEAVVEGGCDPWRMQRKGNISSEGRSGLSRKGEAVELTKKDGSRRRRERVQSQLEGIPRPSTTTMEGEEVR